MHGSMKAFRCGKWTSGSAVAAVCALLAVLAPAAWAQLSPGDLSEAHAHLEGMKRCGSCHKLGNREVAPKCLECHGEIAAMRTGGRGLHAAGEYGDCVGCHVEHQGRDYDLVHWPGGRDRFDHVEAGYPLTGAHARLDCRQCHTAKHVTNVGALRSVGKDPGRTFLGLVSACASCHDDVHRGQFTRDGAARVCTECHDTEVWQPASGFDHARAAFVLTGRHLEVDCVRCHEPLPAAGSAPPSPRFTGLVFASCTDCHRDPHESALGADCTRCHTTGSWRDIIGEGFDHARTEYPLAGRHLDVTCAACHGGDRRKPAHAVCRDCHADAHGAVTTARPRLNACEECHTVAGFRPARFGLEEHAQAAFPLWGAHPAVPCLACHEPLAAAAARAAPYDRASDLAPAHAACTDCHRDPHGNPPPAAGEDACLGCHDESSWRRVAFDHGRTTFPLTGRHADADCRACHGAADGTSEDLPFAGVARDCAGCHEDVHQGTLAAEGAGTACDRCHVTTDWFAENFDHDRDSRFPLRGGHETVACRACHLPRDGAGARLLHYKPLPVDCRACHANVPDPAGGRS